MEQGLSTSENKELTALKKISHEKYQVAINILNKQFDRASDLMPSKIEQVFTQPKISELVVRIGKDATALQIRFELIKLAELMSVGGNLNTAQVNFIADELIELYPTESIADFKICFRRGAMGAYGQIQRMDGITLREWMAKYLEEKYLVMEDILMREKDDIYKPQQLTEQEREHVSRIDIDAMLKEYSESIKSFESKAVLPLTQKEIEEEGQEKPKRKIYIYDETEAGIRLKEVHQRLFLAQEKSVRERHPEWSEEQIQERCNELKEQTIYEETKPKFCTDIGKIWENKKKKRIY